nr:unnamed protein product [Digitaria exilis]
MSAAPARTLADLDGDVLAHCAGYLGARDVVSLAMACRPLRAAAYCDAVWHRLFRDQWPVEKVPCRASGLRELYIQRHTEVHQMKFDDPQSAIYYLNPAETTPNHLMLDRNSIWLCQGLVAKKFTSFFSVVEIHRNHGARITCMRLFPLIDTPLCRNDTQNDENALVTSSTDRTIRLCWKGQSRGYKGHSAPVTALADKLLVGGECKVLASGGEDCTIRLWHKPSLLVSSSKDSKIKVWDTVAPSSGSSSCVGSTHVNSSSPPIAMKCHESLCYMAAGSEVTMVDLRTMKKASVLALDNHRILSCEMLPSEWLICTGTKDKALLWDIRKAQELPNKVAEMQSDGPVTLLHLGRYKVVTGVPSNGEVHVWETPTGGLLNTLSCDEPTRSGGRNLLSAMAVDGCRIAMAGGSPEGGSVLHYRDFLKSSVPVSLPGKEVSRFWRDNTDDSDGEDYY